MWMVAGIAGGIQPWWHYVGAYQEDRRMYRTPEPVMRWWHANEGYLVERTPVASVGLVWSQRNTDFFGRDDPGQRVDAPYTGFMHALVRARIPYIPIHIDDIERKPGGLSVLILPNVGALSDGAGGIAARFRRAGRLDPRDGSDGPLRRMGRSPRGLCAGRSFRLPPGWRCARAARARSERRRSGRRRVRTEPERPHVLAPPARAARPRATDRRPATSRQPQAHVIRCCEDSTKRTSSLSAERSRH